MNFTFILLLKATAILSISSVLLFIFRRASASLRHWVISLTLIGLILLPFFTALLPSWEVETTAVEMLQEIPLLNPAIPIIEEGFSSEEATTSGKSVVDHQKQSQMEVLSASTLPWSQILILVWLVGSLVVVFRLLAGIYRIHQISKAATPFSRSTIAHLKNVKLLSSVSIETPMTWGFIRPVILLPANAEYWSPETLQTVIQHEVAHIKREDYLVHILSWISVAVYWFHPLIWWFKNSQQIEREKACDEFVLKSGLSQQMYAEQLVQVARNLSGRSKYNPALPMAQFTEIKDRLFAILEFQRDRFRFTRLTQFQWGSFYAGSILILAILMPVKPATLMEMIAPDHPITALLQKEARAGQEDQPTAIFSPSTKPVKPEVSASSLHRLIEGPGLLPTADAPKLQSTITPQPILLERPDMLQAKLKSAQTDNYRETSETQKTAYYGTWSEGKSTYEVWTVGDIIHSPELPYLEAATPDDMVIIEETRKNIFGTKRYRMIITKAGFNGGLIVRFQDDEPMAWNGSYRAGDPLFLYYEDDEFRFLGNHKTNWIIDNLPQISGNIYMASKDKKKWKPIGANDPKIQAYRNMKAHLYRPYEDLPMNDFEQLPYWKNMRHLENPPFDFSSVPVKEKKELTQTVFSKNKKIGGHRKTRTKSGGNAINEKQKFGTLIPNLPENAYLQDFNFHLPKNDFDKITFNLYLYEVNDQGIQQSLLPAPIPFDVASEGWIKLSLSKYNLQTSGDVLAVLELSKLEGKVGLDFIFFSTAQRSYKSFHERTDREWGIWEDNFAWYFNVQE